MNFFKKALELAGKGKSAAPAYLRDKLPEVNAFVDIAFGGSSLRESVPINDITSKTLVVRHLEGLDPGSTADFLYTNPVGRFRFVTTCAKVEGDEAHFDLPASIKELEKFSARRMAERVPWILPVQWRYAPDRRGYGDFAPASMMDLSRGGASLVVSREIKVKAQVEVRFTLKTGAKPFVEVCEVVRATRIETSDKYGAGIRFLEIDAQDERTLVAFLEERQKRRRERGVV